MVQFLSAMGCTYLYDSRQCHGHPEENNYADFVNGANNRKAIHVGDRPFGATDDDVYWKMHDDFMLTQADDLEFLLDNYRSLLYNGNFDIICNLGGNLEMLEHMTDWSGSADYYDAPTKVKA